MIAVDANILIYAHRKDSPFHDIATRRLLELSQQVWAIPWPCLHEFVAITTHATIFKSPTPIDAAIRQVDDMRQNPRLRFLSETDAHWSDLKSLMTAGRVRGGLVHDAKIAAICLQHGVRELWTADRDFSRFPQLKAVNPFAA